MSNTTPVFVKEPLLNWRFVAMLAVLMFVIFVVWSDLKASQQRDDALAHYSSLVSSDQFKDAATAKKDLQAAAERAEILKQLDVLSARYDTLNTNYDALAKDYVTLLAILKAHGIPVPTNLVTVITPKQSSAISPRATTAPGKSSKGKAKGK